MPRRKGEELIQVRATGDWSADSKLSAINNGYWYDPYFETFNPNPKVPNRTSLMCKGYYVRFKVCDWFVREIMQSINGKFQIVSLGSGMDTLFFRLISDYPDRLVKFCEVDFPTVIEKKLKILQENPKLVEMAGEILQLVPGDLRNLQRLQVDLEIAGLDPKLPTIFYAECVVNYLKPEENNEILQWIRSKYKLPVWLAYEQCLSFSNNGFGTLMLDHFKKNGCPLLAMEKYTSEKDQLKQLKDKFPEAYIINVWSAFLKIVKLEKKAFEPCSNPKHQFDEYEALMATCIHYTVRIGGELSSCAKIDGPLGIFLTESVQYQDIPKQFHTLEEYFKTKLKFCTSGHASIVRNNKIIAIGGTNNSSRFNNVINQFEVDLASSQHSEDELPETKNILNLNDILNYIPRTNCAALYSKLHDTIYIFGGRKSPSQPCQNSLILFKLGDNEIEEIQNTSLNSEQTGPNSRWRHGMVLLPSEQLFLFGGRNSQKTLGDAWTYEPSTKLWTEIKYTSDDKHKPKPRHSHSMSYFSYRDSVFVTGGISSDDVTLCLDSCWEYNHSSQKFKRWTELEVYTRRTGHNLCSLENKLILVGGYPESMSYMSDIVIIEFQGETFNVSFYNFKPDISKSFLPFGMQSHLIYDDKGEKFLCIYGGGGNCFSFGSHYNKDAIIIPLSQIATIHI